MKGSENANENGKGFIEIIEGRNHYEQVLVGNKGELELLANDILKTLHSESGVSENLSVGVVINENPGQVVSRIEVTELTKAEYFNKRQQKPSNENDWTGKLIAAGCLILIALIFISAIVGVVTIIKFIF
jgi:hypothetical protein